MNVKAGGTVHAINIVFSMVNSETSFRLQS